MIGIEVQTTSKAVWCWNGRMPVFNKTTWDLSSTETFATENKKIIRSKITRVKPETMANTNDKSLWKATIPSMLGVASIWKDSCLGTAASRKGKTKTTEVAQLFKENEKKFT